MFRPTRLIVPVLAGCAVACADPATAPPLDRDAQASLELATSAATTSTVAGFYFLVPTLAPPPASFSGTFDAALSPVIAICALAGDDPSSPAACASAPIATLDASSPPPQTVTLDAKNENYNALWSASVQAGKRYRAFVSAGGRVLGRVDLQGVRKQKDAVPSGVIAVVVGKPFLFKFRIETGIAQSVVVTPATATLRDVDTPDQSQTFTATVLDLHGDPLAGATVDFVASNAGLVSLSAASAATSAAGEATTTATTIERVSAPTDVMIAAGLQGLADTAVLTVLPTASRPIALPDAYGVVTGTSLVVAAPGVLGNDLDLDGDPLSVGAVTDDVDHGTLTLQPNGSFTYVPAAGYIGTDAFTYTAVDAAQTSLPATVTIEVIAASDLGPVANDDQYAVVAGGVLTLSAPGFLANDADPTGEALTAVVITDAVDHGTLAAFPDGSFTYTPAPGYTGPDAFTYRMRDASGNTAMATVTLTVLADPDKDPIALPDVYAVIEGTTLTRAAPGFLGNDRDPDGAAITAVLITDGVDHGSLSAFPDGSFSYTPNAGYTGPDAFSYRMRDAAGNTAVATVTLQVLSAATTNPIANADSYLAYVGSVLQIPASGFLANDLDPDGGPLTATLITDGVDHGTLTAFPDGSFSYTPDAGYTGPDAFTYRMRDAAFNTADATVTIEVVADPDAQPIGLPDVYTTYAGKTLSVAAAGFLRNDIDPDGAPITATLISDGVDHGTLAAFPDGSFTYTPDAGYTGTDAFAYRMRDAEFNQSEPIIVTIDVRPDPNQAPVGRPDFFAMLGGTSLSIAAPGFLANDVDPEGDALTATLISDGVDHGTLTAFPDGSFTYTPAPGYVGTDTFSYRMRDASFLLSLPTTVTIEVLDPALAASMVAAGRVEAAGATLGATTTSAAVGGSFAPLRVGAGGSGDAGIGAASRLAASRLAPSTRSNLGATPLPTRSGPVSTPAPRSRIDPEVFRAGKVALPVTGRAPR